MTIAHQLPYYLLKLNTHLPHNLEDPLLVKYLRETTCVPGGIQLEVFKSVTANKKEKNKCSLTVKWMKTFSLWLPLERRRM